MEDMRAVLVNMDTLDLFRVDIAYHVGFTYLKECFATIPLNELHSVTPLSVIPYRR